MSIHDGAHLSSSVSQIVVSFLNVFGINVILILFLSYSCQHLRESCSQTFLWCRLVIVSVDHHFEKTSGANGFTFQEAILLLSIHSAAASWNMMAVRVLYITTSFVFTSNIATLAILEDSHMALESCHRFLLTDIMPSPYTVLYYK